jgi:acetoin utilization deacetylase AcuC-like enzyme
VTTGVVYDEIFLKHDYPGHPENRVRLERIVALLQATHVWERLEPVPARPVDRQQLAQVHRPAYIDRVRAMAERGGGQLDPDTYVCAASFQAALTAAGGTLEAALAVVDGRVQNAFALVRPPGHHATPEHGMGFCLFGNVALAARLACLERGLERVAIVDFDVHHGNGTQAMTEDDPAICYISTHQHPLYPGTGMVREVGRGPAAGTLVNIPLSPGAGDRSFRAVYEKVVFPIVRRFAPQLLLVSAGFDAHWSDPLANLALSLIGYGWLTRSLVALAGEVCDGRIVFVLEGGYQLDVLSYGVLNTFRALLGVDEVEDPSGVCPWPREPDVTGTITTLRHLHGLD